MPSVTRRTLRRIADSLSLFVAGTKPGPNDLSDATLAIEEVRRALRLKQHVRARRAFMSDRRETEKAQRNDIRKEVWDRSDGQCECGCEAQLRYWEGDLDEFFGGANRKALMSVEGCWRLSRQCHEQKTENKPSAAHWLILFTGHCEKYGYEEMAIRAGGRLKRILAHRQMQGGEPSEP